jgi:hypothetical protein
MTAWDDERDPVMRALSRLTTHEPDPARAAGALTRGRARLAARSSRRPLTVRLAPRGGWGPAVESLIVAGACGVFLLEVLSRATWLYRF